MGLSFEALEAQLISQYIGMVRSNSPVLKEAGRRHLADMARRASETRIFQLQRLLAARQPRPAARSAIRRRIIAAMREQRRSGISFELFMDIWQHDPLDGLRLVPQIQRPGSYDVTDEDAVNDTSSRYTLKTLRDTFWPEAGRERPIRR
jgi:hypothetical protein